MLEVSTTPGVTRVETFSLLVIINDVRRMFDPGLLAATSKEKAERRAACGKIAEWARALTELSVNVHEVACGYPMCSPIDTAVEISTEEKTVCAFGLPMDPKDGTREAFVASFPDTETLDAWSHGKEAEWPRHPYEPLEFCENDILHVWLGGEWREATVLKRWWRDYRWPKGVYVPYRIRVHETGIVTIAPREDYCRPRKGPKPEHPTAIEPGWRFEVGSSVSCLTATGWQTGTIALRDVQDPGGIGFSLLPYVVQLEGYLIAVPSDHPDVIKPAP